VGFLWFRPQGLIPERRRIFAGESPREVRPGPVSQSLSLPHVGSTDVIERQ